MDEMTKRCSGKQSWDRYIKAEAKGEKNVLEDVDIFCLVFLVMQQIGCFSIIYIELLIFVGISMVPIVIAKRIIFFTILTLLY